MVQLIPHHLGWFLLYFGGASALVAAMFWRIHLLRLLLFVVKTLANGVDHWAERTTNRAQARIEEINSMGVVFFTKGDSVANLNLAMLYIRSNEQTANLKVVHVYRHPAARPRARHRGDRAVLET